MESRDFLVVYDYGTGGVSAVMVAPSRAAIETAYPQLKVIEERPAWVGDAEYASIREQSGFRFDQPDDHWRQFFRPPG